MKPYYYCNCLHFGRVVFVRQLHSGSAWGLKEPCGTCPSLPYCVTGQRGTVAPDQIDAKE